MNLNSKDSTKRASYSQPVRRPAGRIIEAAHTRFDDLGVQSAP
jgi:hypothetical protein